MLPRVFFMPRMAQVLPPVREPLRAVQFRHGAFLSTPIVLKFRFCAPKALVFLEARKRLLKEIQSFKDDQQPKRKAVPTMLKRIKFWLRKHFESFHLEVPVLTAEERQLMPVGIELA